MADGFYFDPKQVGRAFGEAAEAKDTGVFLNALGHSVTYAWGRGWMGKDSFYMYAVEALDGSGATLVREMAKWLDYLDEAKREAASRTPEAK